MKSLLLLILSAYRGFLRPLMRPSCRFYPSCSDYARQSISRLPLARALFLIVRRVCRCHPFDPGGHDPVPQHG